ncbi:hypothetical protein EYZ11_004396 [Aspergillus tanneri]|uniref:Uncharacterized protein n=1 Tax=Aspergillus tanneri TaxID=1220188 RepID=A0A4S3JKY0_9EURO|nr:hypothetical protein EYZ11_004396 [Aspergillus tanneri]
MVAGVRNYSSLRQCAWLVNIWNRAWYLLRGSYASSNLAYFKALADDYDAIYTKDKGCKISCCAPLDKKTGRGVCGFDPDFCGKGCISQCDRRANAALDGVHNGPMPLLAL